MDDTAVANIARAFADAQDRDWDSLTETERADLLVLARAAWKLVPPRA